MKFHESLSRIDGDALTIENEKVCAGQPKPFNPAQLDCSGFLRRRFASHLNRLHQFMHKGLVRIALGSSFLMDARKHYVEVLNSL